MTTYDHTWLIGEWERMGRPNVKGRIIRSNGTKDGWGYIINPTWFDDMEYYIESKPYIEWDHVSDDLNFMATDCYGASRFYSAMPRKSVESAIWLTPDYGTSITVYAFKSFVPGTCYWEDSLVMRPVLKQ